MSKEAYYFSHDANARRDPKIVQMMSVYGYEGYGWYWAIIEMMREEPGHKLDITGKYFYQGLANELSTTVEHSLTFVEDCVGEFKLFKCDDSHMWSESLVKRMSKYQNYIEQKRKAGKMSAQKRKENKDKTTPVQQPLDSGPTNVQRLKETKGKETKEKDKRISYEDGVLNVPEEEMSHFKRAFESKDVESEIRKMERWLYANPKKRYKNYRKFMNGWLERAEKKSTGSVHLNPAGFPEEIV